MESLSNLSPIKTKKWKLNIEKLLLKSKICGVCLYEEEELDHWDTLLYIASEKKERVLKDIISGTFGIYIKSLLLTNYLCKGCVAAILQSYYTVRKIKTNNFILGKYENLISQQINCSIEMGPPKEKELLLIVDNIDSLNVPTRVTKPVISVTQIFLCDIDDMDGSEIDFNFEDSLMKYECPYCGHQFPNYQLFKNHHSLHKDIFYRCRKCLRRFKLFKDLLSHRKSRHLELLSTCETCEIILLSSESKEHVADHTVKKTCLICQNVFETKSDLEKHNLQMHPKAKFEQIKCHKCDWYYNGDLKIEAHNCPFRCTECKELTCIHERYLILYGEIYKSMRKDKIFKCPDCNFEYKDKSELIGHANLKHLSHFLYLCEQCGANFSSPSTLEAHRNHHKTETENNQKVKEGNTTEVSERKSCKCDFCGTLFRSAEAYEAHNINKRLNIETLCQICGKVICTQSHLNVHMRSQHLEEYIASKNNGVYRCTKCFSDFDKSDEFLAHSASHPKGSKHMCRECDQTFECIENFFVHTKKHDSKYDKECPICFKKYTRTSISRHLKSHGADVTDDVPETFVCDVCGENFQLEKALIKHSRKHVENKQCPHCNRNVNIVLYNKHLKTHEQVEKNALKHCPKCDYTTKFNFCMEAHKNRFHLKIRPYKCNICDSTFYSKATLKGHKLTHLESRPKHCCHICGKKFLSKKAVTLHIRLHTGEKSYHCEMCDQSFLSASRRRQHEIRKHFEPSVGCELCHKKLYTRSDLRRHVADCHLAETKRKRRQDKKKMIEKRSENELVEEFEETD